MACGATLKRSHDFDPIHSPGRSPKRICMPGELLSPVSYAKRIIPPTTSPWGEAAQKFVSDQIAARLSPSCNAQGSTFTTGSFCPNAAIRSPQMDRLKLPPSYMAPSLNEQNLRMAASTSVDCESLKRLNKTLPLTSASPSAADVPLLTMKQVDIVCKRIVKEHEDCCREQFDRVLNNKLAEQYESFLKFNHDQLSKRFNECSASYVS